MLNRTHRLSLLASCLLGAALFACSGTRQSGFDDGKGGDSPTTDEDGTFGGGDSKGGKGGSKGGCNPSPDNFDIPGNNCDDDGDGTVDNPPTCDDKLSVTGDAEAFAKTIGICTKAKEKGGYGLVSATFTRGYEQTDEPENGQHGILTKFGNVIKPREGGSLGVLSSGWAREYDGQGKEPFGGVAVQNVLGAKIPLPPAGQAWNNATGKVPPGFPKPASGCEVSSVVANVISLKLELKAPANAKGIQFDFNFYSGEWPAYVCSKFNDGFIAYLTAKGFNDGKGDNVSFDKDNNPVSVNNGFFDRCTPNVTTGCSDGPGTKSECPGGDEELAGTGFGQKGQWCDAFDTGTDQSTNGGATGWLTSTAPVEPGETFTLEFMIWDTGDAMLDSSVLLDHFTWVEGETKAGTARPVK